MKYLLGLLLWGLYTPIQAQSTGIRYSFFTKEGFEQREDISRMLRAMLDWEDIEIVGVDSLGKKAKFKVFILTQDETWAHGSLNYFSSKQLATVAFPEYLDQRINLLQNVSKVICIGTASVDQGLGEAAEVERALGRAKKLQQITKSYLKDKGIDKQVGRLNLGKYQPMEKDNLYQRRVILVGVDYASDANVDLSGALKNALLTDDRIKLKIDIQNYSNFENFYIED